MEGRYGGVTVRSSAPTPLGYNDVAFAASAIGNFDIAEPPAAVADAYARLLAWKLDLHGVDARSTPVLHGRRVQAINGHRDVGSTACPGRYLYARVPAIRTAAAALQDAADQPPPAPVPSGPELSRDLDGDGRGDLLVRDRESGRLLVLAGRAGPGFADRRPLAVTAGRVDLLAGAGDLTGDGHPDLITRSTRTGLAYVRPGRPGGLFSRPLAESETSRLAGMDLLTGVGDLTADGLPDLVAREAATRRVWLLPGREGSRLGARKPLAVAPTDVAGLVGPGDVTGDGRPDLLVQTQTAGCWCSPGPRGTGSARPRRSPRAGPVATSRWRAPT